ncbi:MAG: S41 family peptidase [Candidatus Eiseniibacteriota bacterium]
MRRRFAAAALFALLFALGWWAGRGRASTDLYARLDIFIEVLEKVRDGYVQPVDPPSLIHGAVTGMLRDLDPYAEYLDTGPANRQGARSSGRADAGLTLGSRSGVWTVIAPVAGGAAERAGVRAGDLLLQVDGHSTGAWTMREALESLRGAAGSTVRLSLVHQGDDAPRTITVTREAPHAAPAPLAIALQDGVGYLRLAGIDATTAAQVHRSLAAFRTRGVRRLAIDVRQCATGAASDGAQVAELFLPRGTTLMRTHARSRSSDERLESAATDPNLDWPLAVLGDGGTAGGAEVMMGALQDADRGLIVGARTFGLGAVQTELPLPGGEHLVRLTTAVRETPSGRPIQNVNLSESDDGEDDGAAAESSATPASGETFRTAAGRRIAGGGGIAPDVKEEASAATAALPSDTTAAARALLSTDPALKRAIEALEKSHAPRDVYAGLHSAAGESAQ